MSIPQAITSVPSGQDIVLLTAPFFVGSLLNCILFGTLIVQVYLYSLSYPRDRVGVKILVYGIFILDIVQTVLATHAAWGFLISGWGNPGILSQPPWSVMTLPFMSAIISAIVQIFFAWRIWTLQSTWLPRGIAILIVLIALMQSISSMVASIRFSLIGSVSELPSLTPGFTVWLAGSFVADVLIAGCQISILAEARSKSPFKQTDSVITRLIVHTVQTASVTAVAVLVELILFKVLPDTNVFDTPAFIVGKLYSNVLLANLNARSTESRGSSSAAASVVPRSMDMVHITTEVTNNQYMRYDNWGKPESVKASSMFP
ncbi:hypothetical protein PILCRDRAFT_571209 [Piloderma croceum F 1598]|uniref:DUF6534 domain-containing protein n=1 Tax=Piloderma croceum (strain F 1598) TaxID=765440 RepID=A0A0C3FHD8_PILCF|nr:hypothetical protein PILCRDRAFT_571209 [Piloderma croceum F 1598]